MAQNRESDDTFDLKLCKNLPTTATATAAAATTTAGYGSTVHGHGPDPARIDRVDEAQPRSGELRPDPAQSTEERKRSAADTGSGGGDPVKRAVNRCSGCRKRVGLTGFRCRCGDLFCAEHRYSDRHDCSYDYKSAGRVAIARENPVVRAAKILKV